MWCIEDIFQNLFPCPYCLRLLNELVTSRLKYNIMHQKIRFNYNLLITLKLYFSVLGCNIVVMQTHTVQNYWTCVHFFACFCCPVIRESPAVCWLCNQLVCELLFNAYMFFSSLVSLIPPLLHKQTNTHTCCSYTHIFGITLSVIKQLELGHMQPYCFVMRLFLP